MNSAAWTTHLADCTIIISDKTIQDSILQMTSISACLYKGSQCSSISPCYPWHVDIINARRIHMKVTIMCVSGCVSACPDSNSTLRRVCNKSNSPPKSVLHSKGSQLTDFVKKNCSLFFHLALPHSRPFAVPSTVNSGYVCLLCILPVQVLNVSPLLS